MPLGSGGCFHDKRVTRLEGRGKCFYALGVGRVFSRDHRPITVTGKKEFLCPWGRAGVFTRKARDLDRPVHQVSMPLGSGGCFHDKPWQDMWAAMYAFLCPWG